MIIQALCEVVRLILGVILDMMDILPQFPVGFTKIIAEYFDLIFSNVSLISFFVRIETLQAAIPIAIAAINAEHVYTFVMWIIKKIPVANIE